MRDEIKFSMPIYFHFKFAGYICLLQHLHEYPIILSSSWHLCSANLIKKIPQQVIVMLISVREHRLNVVHTLRLSCGGNIQVL